MTDPESGVPTAVPHHDDKETVVNVIIGVDPHKGIAHRGGDRPRRARARRVAGARITPPGRGAAGVGGAVRAADVGDRVAPAARLPALPAARRSRRARRRRAGHVGGAGAAAGHGTVEQERPERRPLGGDRRVARPAAGGGRRGSRGRCCGCWPSATSDLGRARNRTACRLHALLAELVAGGIAKKSTLSSAERILAALEPSTPVEATRHAVALEHLEDLRRLDAQIADSKQRIADAVAASARRSPRSFGVGPVVAAMVIGYTGDVAASRP